MWSTRLKHYPSMASRTPRMLSCLVQEAASKENVETQAITQAWISAKTDANLLGIPAYNKEIGGIILIEDRITIQDRLMTAGTEKKRKHDLLAT